MHYSDLKPHVAEGLIELRKRIDSVKIPPSKLDESLNVATWNIREFGRKKRLDASIVYIAGLVNLGVRFKGIDVLQDPELRDGIKHFSQWPTIPQLYVKGEFVGGCDIVREMYETGELSEMSSTFITRLRSPRLSRSSTRAIRSNWLMISAM